MQKDPKVLARLVRQQIEMEPDTYRQGCWAHWKDAHETGTIEHYVQLTASLEYRSPCNTVCCVAGHTVLYGMSSAERVLSKRSILSDARELLQLGHEEANWLFASFRTREEVLFALECIEKGQRFPLTVSVKVPAEYQPDRSYQNES